MKKQIQLLGISLLFGTTLMFIFDFIIAYLSPAKAVTLYINNYHEANVEMWILLPIVVIFGFMALAITIKDYHNKNE